MKKFIKNILLPALVFVLEVVGAATMCIAITRSCSAQTNNKNWCIQDLTQEDIDTLVNDNEMLNDRLNMAIRQLDAYRDYYLSVEHLLDAAGIDADNPIIETDAGSDYLQFKYVVDSLEEQNKQNQLLEKQKQLIHANPSGVIEQLDILFKFPPCTLRFHQGQRAGHFYLYDRRHPGRR